MNTTNIHPPLRKWQAAALPLALDCILKQLSGQSGAQVISACTGSGKSRLIAELVAARIARLLEDEVLVITTPTQRLVRQLSATVAEHITEPIAQHYADAKWKGVARVIVCCNASAASLSRMLSQMGKSVGLWIADECHKTETAQIHRFHEDTPAGAAIGFTATPFRSNKSERLQLWNDELYRYTPTMALADGCLVPWRAVTWTGDAKTDISDACIDMMKGCKRAGPGMVNAVNISDAKKFAEDMTAEGIRAAAIHCKMTGTEQDALLDRLQAGGLDALVYVDMLSEGVDFPWLAWGCLRRRVRADVRFIQELGRFLRTNAGKTEAIILDPHGLLEDKAVTLDAALGWDEDTKKPTTVTDGDLDDEHKSQGERPEVFARVADALAAYARNLLLVAIADGIVQNDKQNDKGNRKSPSTKPQHQLLGRLVRHDFWLESTHRDPIKEMLKREIVPSLGAASDLITLFKALAKHRCGWTPGSRLAAPSVEDFEAQQRAMAAEPIYVAAVQRKTMHGTYAVAFVATQGGFELVSKKAITPRRRGFHPTHLALIAIRLAVVEAVRRQPGQRVEVLTDNKEARALVLAGDLASSRNADVNAELQKRSTFPPHEVGQVHDQANPANGAAWRTLSKIAPRSS